MIRFIRVGSWTEVRFRYDPGAVNIIRDVPGREYHAEGKYWVIDNQWVRTAVEDFERHGYTCGGDIHAEEKWKPPPKSSSQSSDVFVALFRAIPERLHKPVYKALARVLHPDAGGDVALMQQLNAANARLG